MPRPRKLEPDAVAAWLSAHPDWRRVDERAIAKLYSFPDFASAVAFVVRIACLAEKRDHHPEVEVGWGRARLVWSTHDAGGLTQLDLDAAEACDAIGP